jgi:hypothetical protein
MAKSDGKHHSTRRSAPARNAAKIKSGETEVTLNPKQEAKLRNALTDAARRATVRRVQ